VVSLLIVSAAALLMLRPAWGWALAQAAAVLAPAVASVAVGAVVVVTVAAGGFAAVGALRSGRLPSWWPTRRKRGPASEGSSRDSDRDRLAGDLVARPGRAVLVGLLSGSVVGLLAAAGPLVSATVITVGVETQVGTAIGLPTASMLPASLEGLGAVALVYILTYRPEGRLLAWCVVLIGVMLLAGLLAQGSHALWYDETHKSLVLPWGIKLLVSFVPPVSGAAALHLVVKMVEGLFDTIRRLQAVPPVAVEPDRETESWRGKTTDQASQGGRQRRPAKHTGGGSRLPEDEVLELVRDTRQALISELHCEPDDNEIATRVTRNGYRLSASRTRWYLARLKAQAPRPEPVESPEQGVVG
jgi:hypothetical protein